TIAAAKRADAVLMGAVGGPQWDDPALGVRPELAILTLRKELQLFANLRPVKLYPELLGASTLKPEVVAGVDCIVVRELTGGTYFAPPKKIWETKTGRKAVDTCLYTEQEIARVVRRAFEIARGRRKLLHSVDKYNVMQTSRLWRKVSLEIAPDYPDVTMIPMLADSCAMHLIRKPTDFDVIVTDNLFGDILTDEAAMLAGSMGMMPSASLGARKVGLFEPIHGSAPDIAGQGKANPNATILSLAMLLRLGLGLPEAADAVEAAVAAVLRQGLRTPDLAEPGKPIATTSQIGDAVAAALGG
ncbi:MAG: 3-isopropylmalate dehydrogenase, partial [Chloroflexi bacterium]|nr:3-isopropylmalate dehydrogenase [Chloroflexota bacterium]